MHHPGRRATAELLACLDTDSEPGSKIPPPQPPRLQAVVLMGAEALTCLGKAALTGERA